jgi:hypothetical protein
MDHGRRMTINLLSYMKISRLREVIPFSRSLTLISSYEVAIERRYADTRCTAGGMVPLNTTPNQIPSHTATMPIPHTSKLYEISRKWSNDL